MEEIFNFKLSPTLALLVNEEYIYTCITDSKLELAIVCWIDEKDNLVKECFDIKEVEDNLQDGSWIVCN